MRAIFDKTRFYQKFEIGNEFGGYFYTLELNDMGTDM